MSDEREIAVIWILYTVSKLLRLNFRVAIAFCIGYYKDLPDKLAEKFNLSSLYSAIFMTPIQLFLAPTVLRTTFDS
ncbi:MAG: hypothetical protein DCF19_00705 [Pseudanabaena frigida]|uniref:Uncharacterized protein n=1 Tax=Pseudanabaena frigida TaxID=945775 RepID=A0A2W4WJJ1_9CYAN|nr:MAG: hypothetical protein DCF19_00705 [Pseudanabaena frigida]